MHIRIITAKTVIGKVYVTRIKCHTCGNDVWDWTESQEPLALGLDDDSPMGTAYCTECKEKISFREKDFLLEATNERAGWFSKRQAKL